MKNTNQIEWASYLAQREQWPTSGRHILAQYDDETIVVYQAYRPEIGDHAVRNQKFGGAFSLSRMSWIKPNFLWMMFRCGWAAKPDQEVVLAIRLLRSGFDSILAGAVHSSFVPEVYADRGAWSAALASSSVRLQWDPDHGPRGDKKERRAIQLGLRGESLRRYVEEWTVSIVDVSAEVREQKRRLDAGGLEALETPREQVYPVSDAGVIDRLGISRWPDPA